MDGDGLAGGRDVIGSSSCLVVTSSPHSGHYDGSGFAGGDGVANLAVELGDYTVVSAVDAWNTRSGG